MLTTIWLHRMNPYKLLSSTSIISISDITAYITAYCHLPYFTVDKFSKHEIGYLARKCTIAFHFLFSLAQISLIRIQSESIPFIFFFQIHFISHNYLCAFRVKVLVQANVKILTDFNSIIITVYLCYIKPLEFCQISIAEWHEYFIFSLSLFLKIHISLIKTLQSRKIRYRIFL